MPRKKYSDSLLKLANHQKSLFSQPYLYTPKLSKAKAKQNKPPSKKQKNYFPSCVNFSAASSDHMTHPGVRHSCLRDPRAAIHMSHWGKRADPEFRTAVPPASYKMTLKYSLDQVMWFRIFCSCTAFISGYWSGSRVAGENYHYRRLIRCRGAAGEEGWKVTPTPAQHGTYTTSGQSEWAQVSSPGNLSRTGFIGSSAIMGFSKLGFIKMLQELTNNMVWILFLIRYL